MKRDSVDEARERARSRAAAVARVLASEDGKVLLDVMQNHVREIRSGVRPTSGVANDALQLFIAEGAQRQIDNLQFYADSAEGKNDG